MNRTGERFFAESPLSVDERRLLLSFSDSNGGRVLSDQRLSRDQLHLRYAAILDGWEADSVDRLRLKLQSHWADPLGVEIANSGQFRWWDVVGRKIKPEQDLKDEFPKDPPAWDHDSIWVRDGKPTIAVSQPYPWMLNRDVDGLDAFADRYGLKFCISNYPSWHRPGECWFVEWRSSAT